MKFYIGIFLVLFSIGALAQHDWNSRNWNKESLGFGCSVDGQMTKPVSNMTELFSQKRFEKIRRLLNSGLPADQYLATFTLESLGKKNEVVLSDNEVTRMQEIKRSDEMVPFCSGCTLWTELPLKTIFDEGKMGPVTASAVNWFETYYKIYYQRKRRSEK